MKNTRQISITVTGTRAKLEGPFPVTRVREATSYAIKGLHFRGGRAPGWDGRHHFLTRPNNTLPAGMVPTVVRAIREWESEDPSRTVELIVDDQRKRPIGSPRDPIGALSKRLRNITLRDYQYEAAKAMLEGERGILKAATNAGKTFIFAALCKALRIPTLLVVPGKELLYQGKDDLEEVLNWPIGIIGDGKWRPEMVTVATSQTLSRRLYPSKKKGGRSHEEAAALRKKKREVQKFLKGVELLCMDECHTVGAKTIYKLMNAIPAYYRFGMSGTPLDRTDEADMRLIAQTGDVLYEVSNKELVDGGYSVPAEVQFVEIDDPAIPEGSEYADVYRMGVVENEARNEVIIRKAQEFVEQGLQVVVIVQRLAHGEILFQGLSVEGRLAVEYITGEEVSDVRQAALARFRSGDTRVLIATNILKQGVSINNIDVLINAAAGKSRIETLQRLGRGLRTGGNSDMLHLVDFADTTHSYLGKHSLKRLQDYRNEACFRIVWG